MWASGSGLYVRLGPNMSKVDLETMRCGLGANYHTNVTVMDGEKGNITTSLAEAFDFSQLGVPTPVHTVNEIVTPAYWEAVAINTAGFFGCATANAAEDLSAISPIYVYEFRAQNPVVGPFGLHEEDARPVTGSAGVAHATEIPFVFTTHGSTLPPYYYMAPPNGFEEISKNQIVTLSETMSQAWINFAKTHDPGFGWQPWTKEEPSRAIFDYNTGKGTLENEKANHFVMQCELLD